jgi:3-hydroxybutyryl-CoA dehydratase
MEPRMSNGHFFEDLSVGQTASLPRTIAEADIPLHSAISMDTDPLHLDTEVAKQTVFRERIAHGMLAASLVRGVPRTKLPRPGAVYMWQSPRFAAPLTTVEVLSLNPATHSAVCAVGIEGEAYVQVPSRG